MNLAIGTVVANSSRWFHPDVKSNPPPPRGSRVQYIGNTCRQDIAVDMVLTTPSFATCGYLT